MIWQRIFRMGFEFFRIAPALAGEAEGGVRGCSDGKAFRYHYLAAEDLGQVRFQYAFELLEGALFAHADLLVGNSDGA